MRYMDAGLWVKTWREAAPRLEAIRRDEIRRTDHVRELEAFEGVFEYTLAHVAPSPTSGLDGRRILVAMTPSAT